MQIEKLLKMNSAELENEISARQKKIKTLKTEIQLIEKLKKAETQNGGSEWAGHHSVMS